MKLCSRTSDGHMLWIRFITNPLMRSICIMHNHSTDTCLEVVVIGLQIVYTYCSVVPSSMIFLILLGCRC